jgi:hypothetical protein
MLQSKTLEKPAPAGKNLVPIRGLFAARKSNSWPAMEKFVIDRFAQGWTKPRLARELSLDRRTVKRILEKVTQNCEQKP